MFTAVLPIRVDQSSFWSSSKGIECIEEFLEKCVRLERIDKFTVITDDQRVKQIAERKDMETLDFSIPGNIKKPYSFEQFEALICSYNSFIVDDISDLIIADHRNLLLTFDDLSRAIEAYLQAPEKGLISVAVCRDYLCQLKSYSNFLGCQILRTSEQGINTKISKSLQINLSGEVQCIEGIPAEISTEVSLTSPRIRVSFLCRKLYTKKVVAQIMPFDRNGPIYGKTKEISIIDSFQDIRLNVKAEDLAGFIFIFTMPSKSGEYDTVELFTPENASWELGDSVSTVFNKVSHEPLINRQQFPMAYGFEGSLCILDMHHFSKDTIRNPVPWPLEKSHIVTDWIDYWHTATID
jgi:hypothetical protein